MARERLYLFDTTLRDGAQTQGVDFSVEDKANIAKALDGLGIDYIEGGWPGANPSDTAFFANPPEFRHAKFTAFGMTRRPGRSVSNDPGLNEILDAKTPAVCIVGKSWDFHVDVALGISLEENLELIADSIAEIVRQGREAMYDAEHFFDGYKANPDFALACLKAAYGAGARWMVLCDTNGGTLPDEVERIVTEVTEHIPGSHLGIHTHNDTENAVANTLMAVKAGVRQVQGTLNGLGERCGNANIISLIPSLVLKEPFKSMVETGITAEGLKSITSVSRLLDEILNRSPNRHQAYVGASAFAHKGGLHVSAVEKDPKTYEHVEPEVVGNKRHLLISDQAGRSNILAQLREFGLDVDPKDPKINRLLEEVKEREFDGFSYDGALASFELMARRTTEAAIADLNHVFATTARPRDVIKEVATPKAAAIELRKKAGHGARTGILFGKESVGLSREDVALADAIISVPLNPDFSSINLAQAVLLVGYEWFQAADDTPPVKILNEERPANKAELSHLFERIERELDARGYFDPIQQRKHVILRNMRNMFQRLGLMESDVRAFQGIIKGLTMKLKDRKDDGDPS